MSTAIFDFVETMRWREANLLAGGMVVFAFAVILTMILLEKRFAVRGTCREDAKAAARASASQLAVPNRANALKRSAGGTHGHHRVRA